MITRADRIDLNSDIIKDVQKARVIIDGKVDE